MDQVVILNRISCLMTIISQNLIHSFEIAPGPITTSIRKEPYEYAAHPFSYSKEIMAGRLEIWDCTGRLVFSMRRTNLPTGAQQQRTPTFSETPTRTIGTGTRERAPHDSKLIAETRAVEQPSTTPAFTQFQPLHGGLNVKRERSSLDLELISEMPAQRKLFPTASRTRARVPHSSSNLTVGRASQVLEINTKKRKRTAATKLIVDKGKMKSPPRGSSEKATYNPIMQLTY